MDMADVAGLVLKVVGLLVLDAVLLASLIAIPIGLPGNFVIVGAAVVTALVSRFALLGWWTIGIFLAAAIAGEIIEGFLGPLVAGRYGATRWGMIGAVLGGIGGALIGTAVTPVIGTVIGSFLGTAMGAPLLEWTGGGASRDEGMRAGFGAFLGKSAASAIKLAIGIAMVAFLVVKVH